MKQKQFFIGLDVHNKTTNYAVRHFKGDIVSEGKCATTFQDLYNLLEPYLCSAIVGLEASTSYYSIYERFKEEGVDVRVANTIQMRQLIAKSDPLDARRLSDMLRLGSLPCSYIPSKDIQKLRSLVKLYHNFVREQTRLKNQIHALLKLHGYRISFRTPFTKKWLNQLNKLILSEPDLIELKFIYEHYLTVNNRVSSLDSMVKAFAESKWEKETSLIKSIKGLGGIFSSYIVAQTHPISRFASNKKLRRYAGVVPCTKSSGDKTYANHIPKTSSRTLLRYVLVEGSWHAIMVKGSRLAAYYKKKKKVTKSSQKAIMCVASSLCDIIYKVLTTGEPYQN